MKSRLGCGSRSQGMTKGCRLVLIDNQFSELLYAQRTRLSSLSSAFEHSGVFPYGITIAGIPLEYSKAGGLGGKTQSLLAPASREIRRITFDKGVGKPRIGLLLILAHSASYCGAEEGFDYLMRAYLSVTIFSACKVFTNAGLYASFKQIQLEIQLVERKALPPPLQRVCLRLVLGTTV